MFAGIYGGMYGGSTTSILLNTPGKRVDRHRARGNQMARPAAAGRRWRRRPSAASWRADRDAGAGVPCAAGGEAGADAGPREYFALMVLAFVTVSAPSATARCAG
jgi:putative tricarboxylic transport membrane protein